MATQASVALHINVADPDHSRILEKPLAILPHAGGQRLLAGSAEEQILRQWVNLVATGNQCEAPTDTTMVPMRPNELLVRASMDLRGKRPALGELDAIEADPNAYATFVDQYLYGPEFLERVKDLYDDALLVRREDDSDESRDETSAIYGEALELIAHIVEERPAVHGARHGRLHGRERPLPARHRPHAVRDGAGRRRGVAADPLHRRAPTRRPAVDERVLRGVGHQQHEQEPPAREPLVDPVPLLQLPRHAGRRHPRRRQQRRRRGAVRGHHARRLQGVSRPPGSARVVPLPDRQRERGSRKATAWPSTTTSSPEIRSDGARRTSGRPPSTACRARICGTWAASSSRTRSSRECQTQRAFQMLFLRKPKTNRELTLASEIATRWKARGRLQLPRARAALDAVRRLHGASRRTTTPSGSGGRRRSGSRRRCRTRPASSGRATRRTTRTT